MTAIKNQKHNNNSYYGWQGNGGVSDPYRQEFVLTDSGGIPISVDDSTESLQTISYEHHEIHSGNHYFLDGYVDLAINNVYDIQITTPDTTEECHITLAVSCESETLLEFYENVAINVAGTTLTPRNNDRNSANTSSLTVAGISNTSTANANSDTAVAGATSLRSGIVGAGRNGGSGDRTREIILKRNEDYTLRITATAAGYTDYNINYYHHTRKNP